MAQLLTGTRIYGTGTVDTQLFVSGTNSATSTTTGALQVVGGVGIGGNLYVGGTIYGASLNGTASTATNADNIKTVLSTSTNTFFPVFVDSNNSTVSYEALYSSATFTVIPSSGNIGIGVATPTEKLHVAGNYLLLKNTADSAAGAVFDSGSTLGQNTQILLRDRGSDKWTIRKNAANNFDIYGNTAGAVALTIFSSTNYVGIGTSDPISKFVVNGGTVNTTTYTTSEARIADGTLHLMKTSAGGVFEALRAINNDTTIGTTVRLLAAATSDPFNNANGGKVFIDAVRTSANMDLVFSLNDASGAAATERLRVLGSGAIAFNGSTNYGTVGQILQSNGDAAPTWISTGSLTAASANTATHLAGGTAGQVPYQTAPGVTSFYGPGTAGNVLVSNGTSAPSYNNTLTLTGTTAATSTSTGALQVRGGVGVGGDLFIQGDIATSDTTFNLINATATTVNFAGAATSLNVGATSGSTNVRNNLTVSGNLTVQGTTTIVDSTVTNIADPILTLGGGAGSTNPTADDNKDRGIAFKWVNNGGTTSTGFFGYDDSTGHFTYIQTATIVNEVVTGTKGALDVNLAGGAAMSLVYQSSLDNTAFLAAGTSGYILQTNGTGSPPTWVSASGVSAGSATNADNIRTITQTSNAVYYPTFVDSNNASNAYELVYTTGTFVINPATGYIGMGTSSPGRPLHVVTIGTATQGIAAFEASASGLAIQDNSSKDGNVEVVGYKQSSGTYHSVVIRADTLGLFVQKTTGNVGVGTTSSVQKLTVAGAIKVTGAAALGTTNGTGGAELEYSYPTTRMFIGDGTGWDFRIAKRASSTTADLFSFSDTGALGFNGSVGSAGQLLQSNGSSSPTWVNASGIGAGSVSTVVQAGSASYYPTFVDSNNASATAENLYTTSSFSINPFTGNIQIGMTYNDYQPSSGGNHTLRLNALNTSSIGFHDSGSTIGNLKFSGAYGFEIGAYDGLYGPHNTILHGNVGIGTTSPASKLQITGSSPDIRLHYSGASAAGNKGAIYFTHNRNSDSTQETLGYIQGIAEDNQSAGGIRFVSRNNTDVETFRITSAGSVGIGESSPITYATTGSLVITNTTFRPELALRTTTAVGGTTAIKLGVTSSIPQGGAVISSYISAVSGQPTDLIFSLVTSGTLTERLRITSNGAIAFSGSTSYGTSGQILQSNGNAAPTWINQSTIASGQVNTVLQTASASYYPTFVDSNNASATAESLYTTSSFTINPGTGLITHTKSTVLGSTVAQGDPSATDITANATLLLSGVGGNYLSFGQKSSNLAQWIQSGYSNPTTAVYPISLNPLGGNVGIGTLSPNRKLHVQSSGAAIQLFDASSNGGTGIFFAGASTLKNWFIGNQYNVSDVLEFTPSAAVGTTTIGSTPAVTMQSGGNVGIGVNSPEYLLDLGTLAEEYTTDKIRFNSYNGPAGGVSGYGGTAGGGTSLGSGIIWKPNYSGYSKRSAGILQIGEGNYFRAGLAFYTNNVTDGSTDWTEAMRIGSNGNVAIGAGSSPSLLNKFEVSGTAGQLFSVSDSTSGTIFAVSDVSGIPSVEVLDTGLIKFAQYNGQVAIGTGTVASSTATVSIYGMLYTMGTLGEIRSSSEITAYYSSDARLKENIKLIENPITIIDQIRGVTFDWTEEHMARRGGEDGYFVRKHDIGVIAQEVQAVLPELVGTREDGYLAVKYEKMVPLLIEAIKEQQKTIDKQQESINNLILELANIKDTLASVNKN